MLGVVCLTIGLLWPWLSRLPLGRLPGDITIQRQSFNFYFPLTTSIVLSVLLTVLLWFWRK